MKVLIFGASGMLGSTLFRSLSNDPSLEVYGTVRTLPDALQSHFPNKIIDQVSAENTEAIVRAFNQVKPQVVINCLGLIKQLSDAKIASKAIFINSQIPHQLSELCQLHASRFIQISTDCVFSGKKGNYSETDVPDATDIYGRSKLLGEVIEPHALTIRTSMIGPELASHNSLLEWFLAQQREIRGFTKAIFSGLPTTELAKIIKDLLYRKDLTGLYHVAADPINKYELLSLISEIYKKPISIIPDASLNIDRSLNANRFQQATGYIAPNWRELIQSMYHYSFI